MRTRTTISDPLAREVELATYNASMVKTWSKMYGTWCTPQNGCIIDDASKRRTYKQVDHTKWTAKPSYTSWVAYRPSYYGVVCPIVNLTWHCFAFPPLTDVGSYAASQGLALCPDPFASHYDRWMKVKPTMATRTSLSVFLAELRDVKSMFSLLPKRHIKGCSSWKDVRETLRYTNGLHLNYNFGWKPFLADIVNVRKAYNSYEERLYKFMARSRTELRQRVRDTGTVDSTTVLSALNGYKVKKIVKGSYTLTSNFAYTYEVPYSGTALRARAWLDSLGLNVDPATFWQLLPYSFVIDWVVDVSGTLNQFSSDWSEPYLNWIMAGTSVKYNGEVSIQTWDTYWNSSEVYGEAVSGTFSAYRRRLGYPRFTTAISTELDADKIRLMSSLLASRAL